MMPLQARRIYRYAATVAFALAFAYGIGSFSALPLPYIAAVFAMVLAVKPVPPIGPKKLLALLLIVAITLTTGILLIPLLFHFQFTAVLVAALGIYLSFYLTVNKGQVLVGMFLVVGITLVSAMGTISYDHATMLIHAMWGGLAIAVISQWIIYPIFPEDTAAEAQPPAKGASQCNWIALRATIIVLPVYLLVLVNPSMYLVTIMKGVSLAQQSSQVHAHDAGRELLGSTLLGGVFAVAFWILLSIFPHLWMYFLFTLIFGMYFSSKIYQLLATRYPASYWLNVFMTMLLLLGPAVEDTATGDDVYERFFIRMSLFIFVTLYAVAAVYLMEYLRYRHILRKEEYQSRRQSSSEQIDVPDTT